MKEAYFTCSLSQYLFVDNTNSISDDLNLHFGDEDCRRRNLKCIDIDTLDLFVNSHAHVTLQDFNILLPILCTKLTERQMSSEAHCSACAISARNLKVLRLLWLRCARYLEPRAGQPVCPYVAR
ncbi:hypothetical protein PUN28_020627 [Cardiocondyla obscurior]|uniref:Uncharacterized protein n=1 Tax=Cardiocondyla obscurior TaxID=286306 RepID=A0AAW2E8S7_9HYME